MKLSMLSIIGIFFLSSMLYPFPHEEAALGKTICGVGFILSSYGFHKTMNLIIRRDTRNLQNLITMEEARPVPNRPFAHHSQQERDNITYLRYATTFMTSWLASAGFFLLYQSQIDAK